MDIWEGSDDIRPSVVYALGVLGDAAALPTLQLAAQQDPSAKVRSQVAKVVKQLSKP